MLTEAAPAKINLALHVTGRRPDGYHLLDSLVVFAGAHDRLTATPAQGLSLTLGGQFAPGLKAEPDNLVLRAARALAAFYQVEPAASLHLEKTLPVASGIGGGSADAAAALRLLTSLWRLPPAPGAAHAIAAGLGADIPVCVESAPRRMTGIGEILSPAPQIPACGIVLVNPGVAVMTAPVFRARSGAFSPPLILPPAWTSVLQMVEDLSQQRNDLQTPATTLCPVLHDVLQALSSLQTCCLARMSGSGATCFGLFSSAEQATAAASQLARPGWWCWGGALWQNNPTLRDDATHLMTPSNWGVAKR